MIGLFRFKSYLQMKNVLIFFVLTSTALFSQSFTKSEMEQWKKQAQRVTIIRDNWGIAHIYGKSDADAVFGTLYAQAEDDFERVELNYINALGRLAEVEGESKIYNDLRTRLFQDSTYAIKQYKNVKSEMKLLMQAFADGLNYFLQTHPQLQPKLIKRFQPWMPLLFSEGSIGGDIEAVSLMRLKDFYGDGTDATKIEQENLEDGLEPEPKGSNGFAVAPSRSATGNALFMINPHTSFYFRPEIHVNSEQGMNVYGAVTWGQYFIYQGFNQHCGWMHATSMADAVDEYKETIVKRNDSLFYKYGSELRKVKSSRIILSYKTEKGKTRKVFTVYHTHHGPVIYKEKDEWISIKMMQDPIHALEQSFTRTKSKGLEDFKKALDIKTNTSNNTIYADANGNIAYWHGDFMPKRNPNYNFQIPVDGSDPETDWKGLHSISEIVNVVNPKTGWIQNCNSTPFTVSGESSPSKNKYPAYMAPDQENPRGIHAVSVLSRESSFTIDKLIQAAYDPYLPGFEKIIPSLLESYTQLSFGNDTIQSKLHEPITLLRQWDLKYSTTSIAMTLAFYWGQELRIHVGSKALVGAGQLDILELICGTSPEIKLKLFSKIINDLNSDFGTWKVEWGDVNRFQRLTGKINETFDDAKPSIPVAFTSSFYGSLANFGARKFPGTKKMYGYVGNSFVAAVEFGKRIKAKSVLAGGVSNDPTSKHFTDQALIYCKPEFKDVLFYREEVEKHIERKYHPGE